MKKSKRNLPKISIVVVTLNNQRTLEECVKRIKEQDYPKELIEYLGIDGGSTDGTKEIFKKYDFEIIDSPVKRDAEGQRAIGIKKARHNLIVSLDADNYLPSKQWLRQMVTPFIDDPNIVHANTLHYTYRPNDNMVNRYFALFGVNDPIAFYVGRPDRLAWIYDRWDKGNIIKETKDYYLVEFDKESLTTVGCNGVVYRRDLVLGFAKSSPGEFLHIDVFADLLDKGYNRFVIVKNDVIHDTASSLFMLLRKRVAFLDRYYFHKKTYTRRYLIYNPKNIMDNIKLFLFVFYTLTLFKTLLDSMRGFVKIRDIAWFLHPIICLVFLYTYSWSTMKRALLTK